MSFLDPIIMHDCVTSNACDWIGSLLPIASILSCCPTVVLELFILSKYLFLQSTIFASLPEVIQNVLCFHPEDKESFKLRIVLALLWPRSTS